MIPAASTEIPLAPFAHTPVVFARIPLFARTLMPVGATITPLAPTAHRPEEFDRIPELAITLRVTAPEVVVAKMLFAPLTEVIPEAD